MMVPCARSNGHPWLLCVRKEDMGSRRELLKSVAAAGAMGIAGERPAKSTAEAATDSGATHARACWLATLQKIATPGLESLSRRELKKLMPVEASNAADRARYTHLEAFGRLLCGISAWLVARGLESAEALRQKKFIQ